MNHIDLVIVVVIALFAGAGWIKGLIKEVGSVLGYFVGIWVAGHFYMQGSVAVKPFFASWPMGGDIAAYAASFIIIFFIAQIAFGALIGVLDGLFKLISFIPFLKTINRSGGAVVGAVEGLLIASLIIFVLGRYPFSPDLTSALKGSAFAPQIQKITEVLLPLFPNMDKFTPSIFDMKNIPVGMKLEDWQRMMPENK